MKVLLVRLSSLGDVVHTLPAVQDMLKACPQIELDWIVEPLFADIVRQVKGVRRVIPLSLRSLKKKKFSFAHWKNLWRARRELKKEAYDAVIDAQGLTKSALVAYMARLRKGGRRYALPYATEGASFEAPSRWLAHRIVKVPKRIDAVTRSRHLFAQVLGYSLPTTPPDFGLAPEARAVDTLDWGTDRVVAFIMGSSRADKCWPLEHWKSLAGHFIESGYHIALVHGNAAEAKICEELMHSDPVFHKYMTTWPRLPLSHLLIYLAKTQGSIGVDSGPSHIACALDLPHVQIYRFDTAWRTGPQGKPHQCSVFDPVCPSVDAVWQAWETVSAS